ncbi:MAG: hypothetical protein KGJ58_01700 [Patescibacteria group bacterium]|nr:hypothetical protein [Patescibacteria group bacterium]MDE2218153.1 hypothetical protein [Patescibacteria group bacterium]
MPKKANPLLLSQIQADTDKLKNDPTNVDLRTSILNQQVNMTADQLEISKQEAGRVVKTFTTAYAKAKGLDPKEIMDALTVEEQKILDYSADNPKLYGVDLITANKIAGYLGLGSGVLLTAAIVVFSIALFTVGWEVAAGIAAAEGVVATIGAALGSPLVATGGFLFLLSQYLGHLSNSIPQTTKQMIDNGSIGPGLRITAIKQAEETRAKIGGTLSPGSFTGSQFSDYAAALEANGVSGFNDPCKLQSVPYSRTNLADLVKCIYGKTTLAGKPATVTKLIQQLAPYIITTKTSTNNLAKIAVSAGSETSAPQVKVFTGIVSQGTLGEGLTFTPRQDDIIESIDELQNAAQNNLAPFLAALPSKVVYEVKIVSSVTTKDGFRQTGQAQKVLSGYATDGTPRYKTVINKFATLTIYLLTEKGARTKISTIVLGPTDAVKFQPTQNHLTMLEKNIQTSVVTNSVSEIKTIQTVAPITIQAPTVPPPAIPLPTPPPPAVSVAPSPISVPTVLSPVSAPVSTTNLADLKARLDQANNYYRTGLNPLPGTVGQGYNEMVAAQKAYDEALAKTPQPAITTTSNQDIAKQKATTLSEFYSAIGQPLPSIQNRAAYYEFLGLGKAAYYTGTAEQNTKLLYKLQGK